MPAQKGIPSDYSSALLMELKRRRTASKEDRLEPIIVAAGSLVFKISRSFGFCFGVRNALKVAYHALAENPGKRIFLLSEMIHNPHVNADLAQHGVRFLLDPAGAESIPFESLTPNDIVIIPAFGTTLDLLDKLKLQGVDPLLYDTTCSFVQRVWKQAEELGRCGYSIVIHGKAVHEETRALFSRAERVGPSVIVENLAEAQLLCAYVRGRPQLAGFEREFNGRCSQGFDPGVHLKNLGVVHQTTMLATQTEEIVELLRAVLSEVYGTPEPGNHLADTRNTLCYATCENQRAVEALLSSGGDLALVVGGYNSSNTAHLAELCQRSVPTYFVESAADILDLSWIRHLDLASRTVRESSSWMPVSGTALRVLVTAGASCPDSAVEAVLLRLAGLLGVEGALLAAAAAEIEST